MENSYFLRSKNKPIDVAKFQFCTWEFDDDNSLIEFGMEIKHASLSSIQESTLELDLYISWLDEKTEIRDFYTKLKESNNSRFIFNDFVSGTKSLDGGINEQGVVHSFDDKDRLCILPVKTECAIEDKKVKLIIELDKYKESPITDDVNIYIRVAVSPKSGSIATHKRGITKSTIIYDIKLNESRNISKDLTKKFRKTHPCKIDSCFCFHIIPNNYNITFIESESLKSVRALEFEPFRDYLDDQRIKENDLLVIFSKKDKKNGESHSFFSIYTKERIGAGQVALALLVNMVCSFLFVLPAFRNGLDVSKTTFEQTPVEFFVAIAIAVLTLVYFFTPVVVNIFNKIMGKRK